LAHGCSQFWGGAARRLTTALGDPACGGSGGARTLASEVTYRALCAARADLCDALDALCVPPAPWRGGAGEPADLRGAALALCGGLAADRADPPAGHDAIGRGWLATGAAVAADVAAARRLLVAIERAFSAP
jgi:hypothetical protein